MERWVDAVLKESGNELGDRADGVGQGEGFVEPDTLGIEFIETERGAECGDEEKGDAGGHGVAERPK